MEKISRSQKKRIAEGLQRLGKKLVNLSGGQLETLEIPDALKEAVATAQGMNHKQEAYRRQIQYIGRLMRELDADQVEMALEALERGQAQEKRRFALVERWRNELVSGDDGRLFWILENVPSAERQPLTTLVENARKKGSPSAAKTASRKLFRYLSGLDIPH
jgi:ribosome-associated protein